MIPTGCFYTSSAGKPIEDLQSSLKKLLNGCGDKRKNKVNGRMIIVDEIYPPWMYCVADGSSW
jgi:hypothetical protein